MFAGAFVAMVVLTQAVSRWTRGEAIRVPAASAWVVRLGTSVGVFDARGRRTPWAARLDDCLQTAPAFRADLFVELVGERGVLVDGCLVTGGGIEPVTAPESLAEFGWFRPATQESLAWLARFRRTSAFRALQRRELSVGMSSPPVEVARCGCSLAVSPSGLIVLRGAEVDDLATFALWRRLDSAQYLSGLSLETTDGGVNVRHRGSEPNDGCPTGESFDDQIVVKWDAASRQLSGERLPPHTVGTAWPLPQRQTALRFAAEPSSDAALSGATSERSDAERIELAGTPLSLVDARPEGAFAVKRGDSLDRPLTEQLHALLRARCSDWPTFDMVGARLLSEREWNISRCGGEVVGCDLALQLDAQGSLHALSPEETCLFAATRTDRGDQVGPGPEQRLRDCVHQYPEAAEAELRLADWLRAHDRADAAAAHVELARHKQHP